MNPPPPPQLDDDIVGVLVMLQEAGMLATARVVAWRPAQAEEAQAVQTELSPAG